MLGVPWARSLRAGPNSMRVKSAHLRQVFVPSWQYSPARQAQPTAGFPALPPLAASPPPPALGSPALPSGLPLSPPSPLESPPAPAPPPPLALSLAVNFLPPQSA